MTSQQSQVLQSPLQRFPPKYSRQDCPHQTVGRVAPLFAHSLLSESSYEHPRRQRQVISLIVGRQDDGILLLAGRRRGDSRLRTGRHHRPTKPKTDVHSVPGGKKKAAQRTGRVPPRSTSETAKQLSIFSKQTLFVVFCSAALRPRKSLNLRVLSLASHVCSNTHSLPRPPSRFDKHQPKKQKREPAGRAVSLGRPSAPEGKSC